MSAKCGYIFTHFKGPNEAQLLTNSYKNEDWEMVRATQE